MGHVGAQSDLLGEEVAGFGKAYAGFEEQVELPRASALSPSSAPPASICSWMN